MRRSIRLLSAGEKKRVALADALLLRPRFLLLDDFFAGLDSSMREAAAGILANAAAFSGVVATGHEIEELVKISSRVLVLSNGCISDEIVVDGTDVAGDCRRVRMALTGGGR
jgi:energy-coupling factor transporter ATP-binding protein EcfA2